MARILLGEELGAGWAGAHLLGVLGAELATAGHDCVFALRDLSDVAMLPAGAIPLQAPIWRGPAYYGVDQIGRGAARIGGVADLLVVRGLADEQTVATTVTAWERLIDFVHPECVIGHFAPALLLAAAGAGMPRILAGEGHNMPTAVGGRLPRHDALQPPVARNEDIIRAIDAARHARGLAPLAGLDGVFEADARLVFTHPALDIHQITRREPVLGPLRPPARHDFAARAGAVAMLSITQANVEDIVFGLVAAGVPLGIHVRGAPPAMLHYLEAAGASVSLGAAMAMIPAARVLLHGGEIEPAQIAALAGVPQLLLPEPRVETRWLARRLEELGLARLPDARRKPTATIETAVRAAHGDGDLAEHCRGRADELAVAGPFAGAPAVGDAVAALTG